MQQCLQFERVKCIVIPILTVFPSTFVDESGKSTEGVTFMKATISAEKTYYLNALTQTGCWIPKNITASHASLQLILDFYTRCVHVYFRRHGHMYTIMFAQILQSKLV